MKINKKVLAILIVVLVLAFVYYRYDLKQALFSNKEDQAETTNGLDAVLPRELSATKRYPVPKGEEYIKFSVLVDKKGVITGVVTREAADPGASNAKLDEFSTNLSKVIVGKKLTDLKVVDKIGTSSLTTAAFNSVIPELQAEL